MGHLIFVVFHLVVLLYGPLLLLLTIPLHLIYAAIRSNRPTPPDQEDQLRCPDCRELVRWDARKCRHCGTALTPPAAKPSSHFSDTASGGITIALVTIAGMILVARACSG